MSVVSIKVEKSVLDHVKLLKKLTSSKSHGEIIEALVIKQLMEKRAFTDEGFLAVGSVVQTERGIRVIAKVEGMRVFFDDGTYVINGGAYCKSLEFISETVGEYEGGPINE